MKAIKRMLTGIMLMLTAILAAVGGMGTEAPGWAEQRSSCS